MKKLFALLTLAFCATATTDLAAQTTTRPVRFMSYNVRHCAGMDNKLDIARTAKVIKAIDAEAVAIQELDSMTTRSNKVYQLKELGRRTSMNYTYARSIPYGGGAYGIGILSKEKPINVKRIPIYDRSEPRVLLVCEFQDYVFACTHLPLTAADRMTAVPVILAEAKQYEKPFFVSGDFNMTPDEEAMLRMRQYFKILTSKTNNTFPADEPTSVIDYICSYRRSFNNISSSVPEEAVASDHRPVVVEFDLPYTAPEAVKAPWSTDIQETTFDLNGNRVDATGRGPLKRGIYIRNNKKYVVK